MVAAEAAGFEIAQASLSPEPEFAQVMWRSCAPGKAATVVRPPQRIIQEAVLTHLGERNEPSLYLPIYTAGMAALAENHLLPSHQGQISYDTLSRIQAMVGAAFSDQTHFKRYDSRLKNIESGWWWLFTALALRNVEVYPLLKFGLAALIAGLTIVLGARSLRRVTPVTDE